MRDSTPPTIRFATFLAPNMQRVYAEIVAYVGRRAGRTITLVSGTSFAAFDRGELDAGFICSWPYVELTRCRDRGQKPAVELLAAPVLQGTRYADRPICFSDVIVHRDSAHQTFLDLRGCSWAYNDRDSHSGYNLTRYTLVCLRETHGFFGRVVEAGFIRRPFAWWRAVWWMLRRLIPRCLPLSCATAHSCRTRCASSTR